MQKLAFFEDFLYTVFSLNTSTTRLCFQCGNELILVSSTTEHPEGSLFPQTTTVYKCSNEQCQEQQDKETQKRLQQSQERVKAEQRRAEERQQKRLQAIQQKQGY